MTKFRFQEIVLKMAYAVFDCNPHGNALHVLSIPERASCLPKCLTINQINTNTLEMITNE